MNAYELGIGQEIEIQTSAARLGEGFNTFNLSRLPQSSLFTEESIAASIQEHGKATSSQGVELKYTVSETSDHLATSLNIHAQAAASFFGVKAEGSASYVTDKSFDENCLVASIRGAAQARTQSLKSNPELQEIALKWLENPKALVHTYGDYYCSELIYGGELIIFIKITTTSVSEKRDVAAKLKASWASGSASTEMESKFEEVTKNVSKEFSIYQVGSLKTPEKDDLPTLIAYAHKYFENTELSTNLFRAVYRPLTHLPFGEPGFMLELENLLRPAWERRDIFLLWLGEYQRARYDYAVAAASGSNYYLPSKYYDLVRKGIENREAKLADEIKANSGRTEIKDPRDIISDYHPDYYQSKLEKREIKSSALWGGHGGGEFRDAVNNLEGLTSIEFTTHSTEEGVIGYIRTRALLKDGKPQDSGPHGKYNGELHSIQLSKGEFIEAVGVRYDSKFVRQLTFWVRTKKKKEDLEQNGPSPLVQDGLYPFEPDPALVQYGPYPPVSNPDQRWPNSKTDGRKDIILCGFHGQSGSWLDALGIQYIEINNKTKRQPKE